MKDWLYFFLDAFGRSFFFRPGMDKVESTNTQAPVQYAPDGWEDIAVGYDRSLTEHGLVRSFSFPLKAVDDSARILRELTYTKGLEQEIYLLITRSVVEMSDTVFKHYHRAWYRGRVDTSSIIDEETFVTFKVEDGGLAKELKTNRATKYDIPLEGPGSVHVYLDGVSLAQTNNFLVNAVTVPGGETLVDCGQASYEGRAAGFAGASSVFYGQKPANLDASDDWLFRTDIRIQGMKMKGEIRLTQPQYYQLKLYTSKGRTIQVIPWTGELKKDYAFDITLEGAAGEKFFLVGQSPALSYGYAESTFTISFESQATPSYCWAMPLSVCMERILEKMTGRTGIFSSTLLTTAPYKNLLITCGDGLRGLEKAGLKISFNDLWEYLRVICRAGFGIEGEKLVVEDILYFYRRTDAINLGYASKLKVTPADELLGNTLKIGYKTPDIDDVNGKYAFNCAHLYEISPKAECKVRELDYVANCITDPYAVEIWRNNFDGKNTTDGQYDNDHFILHCTNEQVAVEPPQAAYCERTAKYTMMNITGMVPFQMMNSVPAGVFTFDANRQKVTFAGARPREFNLTARVRWTQGVEAVMAILVNGVSAGFVRTTSDGATALVVTLKRMLNPGDQVWVQMYNTQSNIIYYAALDITSVVQSASDWKLYRVVYDEVDGLPTGAKDTVFNTELLTPKRLLRLHAPWLNGAFYKMWDRQAKYHFVSTDRNRELRTLRTVAGVRDEVDEDSDEVIKDNILWKPWFFELEVPAPDDLVELMQANPYRPYTFRWNDRDFTGYLAKGGIAPDDNKPVVFRLLCTPDTDLTPLLNN